MRPKIMTSVALLAIIALCFLTNLCDSTKVDESYKILGLFADQGKSHFDAFAPFLDELARRGHEITVVSFFPRENATDNYRDIRLVDSEGIYVNVVDLAVMTTRVFPAFSGLQALSAEAPSLCKNALANPKVRELIGSDEKFDLILTELFNSDCFLGIVHKFKAPFIALSAHALMPWANDRASNPDNPSFIPSLFGHFSQKMTFLERVRNTIATVMQKAAYRLMFTPPIQRLVNSVFGTDTPPLEEIAKNMSAILVNTHFSLHGSRPLVPNVIEVGGMHIPNAKPLPKHIKRFLDDAPQGVLYVSWGSMIRASTIHEEKLRVIVKVLGSLSQKVLWKWEAKDLLGKPANVMVEKWLPQNDVLHCSYQQLLRRERENPL